MLTLLCCPLNPCHAGNWIFNNPYPESETAEKIYYSSFTEQPKTLDPARSYGTNEYQINMQIYEPLLHYDYFIRPYHLTPLIATEMPKVRFLDKANKLLSKPENAEIAYTVYTIHIKPKILFQPHPALAKDKQGKFLYLQLPEGYLDAHGINKLSDFHYTGTRELTIDDYIYQIKRLSQPTVNSPISGLMGEHIDGFIDFAKSVPHMTKPGTFIDLRKYEMTGLHKIDNYTFEIKLIGQYPQFMFWLAMGFFVPVPWEADCFYSQAGMAAKNLSFDWYPIGTGPFLLSENNPNRRIVLQKNPNFRQDYFPSNGSADDARLGYLLHAGALLPLINQAVYTLEKESIPRWNKFLQGYYDSAIVGLESFQQAIQISPSGAATLSKTMLARKVRMAEPTQLAISYLGFNMLDNVVGGYSERARKLRLAISIAVNFDENIAIFLNGRGKPAQGPIPPGIFGYRKGAQGINPYVYYWDGTKPRRRSIKDAMELMKTAGYPGGRDPQTGKPLILNYDIYVTGGPDEKAQLAWMRKQFARIGIDLNVNATQYNRFQDKLRSGNSQIFSWGWVADYPDPENFLFLFYGENSKVEHGGENVSNYKNSRYDSLFNLMKNRPNDPKRQQLIDEMVEILRHDAPWAWGINPQELILNQQWVSPTKNSAIAFDTLKYIAVDVAKRNELRRLWNKPILWPLGFLCLFMLFFLLLLFLAYCRKEKQLALRIKK
jgi:oligopeptide transport system substrate-binding protein